MADSGDPIDREQLVNILIYGLDLNEFNFKKERMRHIINEIVWHLNKSEPDSFFWREKDCIFFSDGDEAGSMYAVVEHDYLEFKKLDKEIGEADFLSCGKFLLNILSYFELKSAGINFYLSYTTPEFGITLDDDSSEDSSDD